MKKQKLVFTKPSRTQQHQKGACDINNIVNTYIRAKMPLPSARSSAMYGDFSQVGSYQECLAKIQQAQEVFQGLSSDIRKRFKHDPGALIEFVQNDVNREEAIKLGLIDRPVAPTTTDNKNSEKVAEGEKK